MHAYEHNGRRISRAQFYAIACDPGRSVAVEACAGAGKTWMLVSRILRALLEGARPHEILAITFTKKAAGEMRQRLHEWLAQFADATPQQLQQALIDRGISAQVATDQCAALRNLYSSLLATGRPVQIRTFHGWFAALLRNAPLAVLEQLALPSHYELLEDDSQAVTSVWRRFYTAVAAEPQARQDFEACVAAHGRSQTRKGLLAALVKRVEFGLADERGVVEASITHFRQQYPAFDAVEQPEDALETGIAHERWHARARSLAAEKNRTPQQAAEAVVKALGMPDLQARMGALRKAFLVADEDRLNQNLVRFTAAQEAEVELRALCAACRQHQAWLHQQRMTRLTRLLISEFSVLKRERGWIDMNDVERAALVMLGDPVLSGWVQQRLDARVRHLLIDEFQDTNPLQWQALSAWLGSYAGAGGEGGAAGSTGPSVFIVGDPKQSIYRFRRAEPQVFAAAKSFVTEGLAGDLLSCDHTHRSAPALVAVVNEVLGAAQAEGHYQGFRPHTTESREAGRAVYLPQIGRMARPALQKAAGPLPWRDSLTVPRELPEEKLMALECRQAASWVAGRLAAGTAAVDIMVLARKRDRLAAMEVELRALRIPAQQPDKSDLNEAPEVQDLVALLDVLVSPTHDLALARALKSPLFALGDDSLVQLALLARQAQHEGDPAPWFELLQKEELLAATLRGLGTVLLRWKGWIDRLPPHDALAAIYHDGDVLARFVQAAPAAQRADVLANLRALLNAALQLDGGRYATAYALVRALKAGGVQAPVLANPASVRLVTIHGAKGLESPVVLLLDTDGPAARAETMGVVVQWPGEAPAPLRFAFIASEGRPPACSVQAIEFERAAQQREELNALYVAVTRARTTLVLSSVQPGIAAEFSWWQRLLPWSTPLAAPQPVPGALDAGTAAPEPIYMPIVPFVLEQRAPIAIKSIAKSSITSEALFGQAVHRLLEYWTPGAPGWPHTQLARASREFALPPASLLDAAAMAERIRNGEGAWAWDPGVVDWQGSEVELHCNGELLRLDRLVRRIGSGEWWVLDYKSLSHPEHDATLLAQLRRYRQAVAAACPGTGVRAAFLTGGGRLIPAE